MQKPGAVLMAPRGKSGLPEGRSFPGFDRGHRGDKKFRIKQFLEAGKEKRNRYRGYAENRWFCGEREGQCHGRRGEVGGYLGAQRKKLNLTHRALRMYGENERGFVNRNGFTKFRKAENGNSGRGGG